MLLPAEHADNRGFTLIEIMLAMFIMMIGLLALLQTANLAIAYNNSNKLRNDAILLADQAIGIERTRLFAAVANSNSLVSRKIGLGFINYSVVNTVTALTAHSLAGDKIAGANNLRITVSWREKGVKKYHSITTTIIEAAN
jgi:prepilin-type N-terminal cleavage/methylation domain-containing protein